MKAWGPNQWTAREFPPQLKKKPVLIPVIVGKTKFKLGLHLVLYLFFLFVKV